MGAVPLQMKELLRRSHSRQPFPSSDARIGLNTDNIMGEEGGCHGGYGTFLLSLVSFLPLGGGLFACCGVGGAPLVWGDEG